MYKKNVYAYPIKRKNVTTVGLSTAIP